MQLNEHHFSKPIRKATQYPIMEPSNAGEVCGRGGNTHNQPSHSGDANIIVQIKGSLLVNVGVFRNKDHDDSSLRWR